MTVKSARRAGLIRRFSRFRQRYFRLELRNEAVESLPRPSSGSASLGGRGSPIGMPTAAIAHLVAETYLSPAMALSKGIMRL